MDYNSLQNRLFQIEKEIANLEAEKEAIERQLARSEI